MFGFGLLAWAHGKLLEFASLPRPGGGGGGPSDQPWQERLLVFGLLCLMAVWLARLLFSVRELLTISTAYEVPEAPPPTVLALSALGGPRPPRRQD